MGNLTLVTDPSQLNMNKVVISSMFRIPAATAAQAQAQSASSSTYPVMARVVPLLMWGDQQFDNFSAGPIGPSWIGVCCDSDFPTSPYLAVAIQTSDRPTVTGAVQDWYPLKFGNSDQFGLYAPTASSSRPGPIALDQWHHLLLSWELSATETSNESGVTGFSTMYCALDDVNKSESDLPAIWSGYCSPLVGGTNNHCSYTGFAAEGSAFHSAILNVSQIPSSPLAIPGRSVNSEADGSRGNLPVEMAELQIFTGVTLDTSVEINRRAFIKSDGTPETDYSIAEALLGKAPEIRLQGSSNWKAGVNSGSLGGLFDKTGTINTYSTGPDITP